MTNEIHFHDRRVASVTSGITKLAGLPQMTPEAVCEGALKAAAVVMLSASDCSTTDVAAMFRDFADAIENPGKPNFGLVK